MDNGRDFVEDAVRTDLAVGTMYASVIGVVRCVVQTLIKSVESLPEFDELEPDDAARRLSERLRDVLDTIDPNDPPEPMRAFGLTNRRDAP